MKGNDSTWSSGFNGTLMDGSSFTDGIDFPDSKYYDIYNYGEDNNYSRRILGDATGEMGPFNYTSSWYNDFAGLVYSSVYADYPWLERGGHYNYDSRSGAFSFSSYFGVAYGNISFRLVLCI